MADETKDLPEPEVPDSEPQTFEGDVQTLLRIGNQVLRKMDPKDPLRAQFCEALANVEEWGESDDPKQNGWVDSKGRP